MKLGCFFRFTVLLFVIGFLLPVSHAVKDKKRGASLVLETEGSGSDHPSPEKRAKIEEELFGKTVEAGSEYSAIDNSPEEETGLCDEIPSRDIVFEPYDFETGEGSNDPCHDYREASKILGLVYENDPGKMTTVFNNVTVTSVRTFFVVLQVCSYAQSNGLSKLEKLMFDKLSGRENLDKLPTYLEAVQRVFCEPDDEHCLSLSAIASHFNELAIIVKLMYLSLKTKPRIDNYDSLRILYLSYNGQLKNV